MTDFPPPVPSGMPAPGMLTPPSQESETKNNWQGIVGAVTGLLGMGPLGVIFGALGLQSVRSGTATNRGLALTGVIVGGLWTVVGFVAVVGAMALDWGSPEGSTFTPFDELVVGDCFAEAGNEPDVGETVRVDGLYVVDCARAHHGEVYYIGQMTESAFPGIEESAAIAEAECFGEVAISTLNMDVAGDLAGYYLFPTVETWARGDREIDCMVVAEGEDLIGSVRALP